MKEVDTLAAAAKYAGISPVLAARWQREGKFPGRRLSERICRALKSDVDAFIAGRPWGAHATVPNPTQTVVLPDATVWHSAGPATRSR